MPALESPIVVVLHRENTTPTYVGFDYIDEARTYVKSVIATKKSCRKIEVRDYVFRTAPTPTASAPKMQQVLRGFYRWERGHGWITLVDNPTV